MEATKHNLLTAKALYQMPKYGGRNELVRGEIVPMSPASTYQGKIAMRLGRVVANFVYENGYGEVYAAETGFTLFQEPDTVRAPDVSFVAKDRIPPEGEPESGFWAIAPDLAAEVISPNDKVSEVQEKVRDYLEAGVRLLWLVDPQTRTVTVYQSLREARILLEEDTLDGASVLPGFNFPLSQLFQ